MFKLKNQPKLQLWKNVLILKNNKKKYYEVFKFKTRSLLNKFKGNFYSSKEKSFLPSLAGKNNGKIFEYEE